MLSGAEARLLESPTLGRAALERLQRSRAAVIGAGTLGGQLIPHLALLQVSMSIVDAGRVEPENLGTQAFSSHDSVGEWKAEARARQVAGLNPDCRLRVFNEPVERLGLAALADCDVLLCGLDSRVSRMRVNELSRQLGKVLIDAALDGTGEWLVGTVSAYDPRRPDAACYACRYDHESLAAIGREGRGPGCPSWRRPGVPLTPPTLQTSALAGVVAGYQALWTLRFLLGREGELGSEQLLIECDGSPRVRCVRLERNPHCLFHRAALTPLRPASGDTIGALLACADADLGREADQLVLHHRSLVTGLWCPNCGARRDRMRMSDAYTDAEIRCGCDLATAMKPTEMRDRLSRAEARALAHVSWADLEMPAADVVTATCGEREAHYIVNGSGFDGRCGR